MDKIVLFFEGSGSVTEDFLTAFLFKIVLTNNNFDFHHLSTPLIYGSSNRNIQEFDALQQNSILDYLIENIIMYSKKYKEIILY